MTLRSFVPLEEAQRMRRAIKSALSMARVERDSVVSGYCAHGSAENYDLSTMDAAGKPMYRSYQRLIRQLKLAIGDKSRERARNIA